MAWRRPRVWPPPTTNPCRSTAGSRREEGDRSAAHPTRADRSARGQPTGGGPPPPSPVPRASSPPSIEEVGIRPPISTRRRGRAPAAATPRGTLPRRRYRRRRRRVGGGGLGLGRVGGGASPKRVPRCWPLLLT
jgi:hypothetical protein